MQYILYNCRSAAKVNCYIRGYIFGGMAYIDAIDATVGIPVQLHVKQLIVRRVVAARRPSVATIMREHRRALGGRGGGAHHNPLTRAGGDETRQQNEVVTKY